MIGQNTKTPPHHIPDWLFRKIVEQSRDAILIVSGTTILYANKPTAALIGYKSPEEIIGKKALNFITTKYRNHFEERIKSRLEGNKQPERFEHELLRQDGSIIQVETTASMLEYDGKSAVLFIGRDITEKKKFESKLLELHRYAAQIGAAQTLVEVAEPTLQVITSIIGYDYANFMLHEDDHLSCIFDVGYGSPYWSVSADGSSPIPKAAREAHMVVARGVGGDIDYHLIQQGILSQLAMPVINKGKIKAVISVESKEANAFTESDGLILEIMAQHVGLALERIEA